MGLQQYSICLCIMLVIEIVKVPAPSFASTKVEHHTLRAQDAVKSEDILLGSNKWIECWSSLEALGWLEVGNLSG